MPVPISHPDDLAASAIYVLRCVTYSALVFHIWEWASEFSFEIVHIWKMSPSSTIKWQYLLSRYLGIAGQLGNVIATAYIHSSHFAPRHLCLGWYIEQGIVCQGLLFSLEVSLILRLYALSGSNTRLRLALYVLVLVEHVIVLTYSLIVLRRIEYIEACLPRQAHIETAVIGCALGVTQCILWGLTIHHSWRKKVPLSFLVMIDGSWVFGMVLVVIGGCTASVFAPKRRPVFNPFSLFAAVLVSTNCRIIINLEEMRQRQQGSTSAIEFTSFFDTGEHTPETLTQQSTRVSR